MDNISFSNIFKDNFLDNFTEAIPFTEVIITMVVAFVFSIIIYYVYKVTCDNVIYSKKFNITMALMSIVTAAIIMSMRP